MCGIAGILALGGGFRATENRIVSMTDTLAHRGPDGRGAYVSPDGLVGLGHRRLSIIDLSAAASQPMSNEDGTLWVVFNGEIYNHADVRRELEATGRHRWKTDHSDTEVILHAFEEWGIESLSRFRGMFAIGLWNAVRRELWLVRDRMGIKPVYWWQGPDRFAFASEVKALLTDPAVPRQIDEVSFFHYLSFLAVPAPATLFRGIRKLAAGTWLKVRESGAVEERRYYEILDHVVPPESLDEDEIGRRLLEELRTSVRLRKVSDVPVGIFLSGGVDSSVNTALFSEGEGGPVKAFTISYGPEYPSVPNEAAYARRMAEKVGAEHHVFRLGERDLLDFLPLMIRLQDEPIADPVCVPTYFVSKLAREHGVIVCQVGEGADELFVGYPHWRVPLRLQSFARLPVPRLAKRAALLGMKCLGRSRRLGYEWLRRDVRGRPVFWGGAEAFTDVEKRWLLSPRMREQFRRRDSWEVIEPFWARYRDRARAPSDVLWMSYLDLNFRLPDLLLMRVDKMSMGVSLEARVPYLDHRFVSFALGLPPSLKVRDGTLKYILKRAVRGLVPDELIDRPKQGFAVPIQEWLRGALGDRARGAVERLCRQTDLLDPAAVGAVLDAREGLNDWVLLNFALWWEHVFG